VISVILRARAGIELRSNLILNVMKNILALANLFPGVTIKLHDAGLYHFNKLPHDYD
jgi:hypothetical protein